MAAGQGDDNATEPRLQQVLVVADDLTGAADAAVGFTGRSGVVHLGLRAAADWPVDSSFAISSETRHCPATEAAARLEGITAALRRPGVMIYKKVDSLGRGAIGAELLGMRRALSQGRPPRFVILAPALPAMGRTTVDGIVHVDGRPLVRNGNPVDLVRCLSSAGLSSVAAGPPDSPQEFVRAVRAAISGGADAMIVDTFEDGHLGVVAKASQALGESVLLAGARSLAVQVANELLGPARLNDMPLPPGPRLFVVGSRSQEARAQTRAFAAAGGYVAPVSPAATDGIAAAARQRLAAGEDVVVVADPALPLDPAQSRVVADALGRAAQPLLELAATVVLTGGETAAAVLEGAGVRLLRIRRELEPGVVLSEVVDRELHVVTKAGSFGDADLLVRLSNLSHPRRSS